MPGCIDLLKTSSTASNSSEGFDSSVIRVSDTKSKLQLRTKYFGLEALGARALRLLMQSLGSGAEGLEAEGLRDRGFTELRRWGMRC
mmetsp:Transcript_25011/g.39296  ORF Transcript_25011/g.39296 Transcript_25011/m.39296 type:complete len:87 (+) Transcript_25011:1078-1338(+)